MLDEQQPDVVSICTPAAMHVVDPVGTALCCRVNRLAARESEGDPYASFVSSSAEPEKP
ncbi:hypothetical protein [Saccharopolyspora hattusasensis]|uniref:hypothetical protein n=1 Tax=Saccharopolyspora hattusasensis TaxID=1128679 RepID=UPI003D99193A